MNTQEKQLKNKLGTTYPQITLYPLTKEEQTIIAKNLQHRLNKELTKNYPKQKHTITQYEYQINKKDTDFKRNNKL